MDLEDITLSEISQSQRTITIEWKSGGVSVSWGQSFSLETEKVLVRVKDASAVPYWRRKWQPTPVFLPGESQRWGSLVGCHLWGLTESDTTEVT